MPILKVIKTNISEKHYRTALLNKSRLDQAGSLREMLEQEREVEHYDRIAYQRGFT